jgi:hypothetical protein
MSSIARRYWLSEERATNRWRDQLTHNDGQQRERYFEPGKKELHIIDRVGGQIQGHVVASVESGNRIVLRRAADITLVSPGVPPFWVRRNGD